MALIMTPELLNNAITLGLLRPVDVQFARHLGTLVGDNTNQAVLLAAALASHCISEGNLCLNLTECGNMPIFNSKEITQHYTLPTVSNWEDALSKSPLVATPDKVGDFDNVIINKIHAPLILDKGRLYLERYWQFETSLAIALETRLGTWSANIDLALLTAGLDRLFPVNNKVKNNNTPKIDWQRVAAALAVLKPFCVISGGPGTGKTHTVTAILTLLIEQAMAQPNAIAPKIALGVPTGKAAARLTESMRARKQQLPISPEIAALLPEEAITLHRLLGFRPGQCEPRHGPDFLLNLDILVVDEASMLDLPMMARLLAALPSKARLLLLGDRHQLASVEVGKVLGDLCGLGKQLGYSAQVCKQLAAVTKISMAPSTEPLPALADHQVILEESRRFNDTSGIGKLAQAVNIGNAEESLKILKDASYPDVSLLSGGVAALMLLLQQRLIILYQQLFAANTPQEAIDIFNQLRILCAVRAGPFGVRAINQQIEQMLVHASIIKPNVTMYAGRPILVTANDYTQHLYNGDVGLVLPDKQANGALRVFFETQDGIRRILPARVPAHESVYAMTVHKSQGSEFKEVVLLLPDTESRVVTRELIYTGLTRAKQQVTIVAEPAWIKQAVHKVITRSSGLFERLWQQPNVIIP